MRLPSIFAPLLLLLAGCAAAQPGETPSSSPEAVITAEEVEAHVRFLAADELMGRAAGTPGGAVAARYIAEQFRALGAAPVPGAVDGYFQPVPLLPPADDQPRWGLLDRPLEPADSLRIRRGELVVDRNVLGFVEGSDPALRDEVILLTAHYDHEGAGLHLRGATPADSIFNGARDNAMGIAALLAAADALAQNPPKRSVLLLAVGAEEHGMLGSEHYAAHPLVPLERTRFVLNNDGAGYTDTSIVTVVGLERTTAAPAIRSAAEAFGLSAIPDPVPEQNLFDRSDNVSFAVKGVPAPTFSPGFRSFGPELFKYYHRPADEVDAAFDMGYLLRFSRAYARAARNVADMDEAPRWIEGDKYAPAAEALYGGGD